MRGTKKASFNIQVEIACEAMHPDEGRWARDEIRAAVIERIEEDLHQFVSIERRGEEQYYFVTAKLRRVTQ